jgi:hypothetical protein
VFSSKDPPKERNAKKKKKGESLPGDDGEIEEDSLLFEINPLPLWYSFELN